MNAMKSEGYKFPPQRETDAMFTADTAPEWANGEVCHRCRVTFSLIQRKHHCRACGQVFCGACTTKSTTLPKYGIEKEVDVHFTYIFHLKFDCVCGLNGYICDICLMR